MEETTNTQMEQPVTEPAAEPQQTAPEPPALTAEDVSKMIADAVSASEKKRTEAQRLAEMTDQQRAETERDTYKQQLEALQKEIALTQMQNTARTILAEKGVHLPDPLLKTLVTDDATTTKTNVEAFSKLFSEAVESAVKERLKGEPPKRQNNSRMTKEQIFAIRDDAKRIQAIHENMDLFT